MKEKIRLGFLRLRLMLRLTRISVIAYLIAVIGFFAFVTLICFDGGTKGEVFRVAYTGGVRYLFGGFSMLLGCVAGAVSVFRFGKGGRGDLLRLLPERSEVTFVTVSLCEFIKVFTLSIIGFAFLTVFHTVNGMTCNTDIRYILVIFAEYCCYLVLYFAVGAFFSALSGRVITTVLGCASYYMGIGLICYTVMGLNTYLPIESSGFLSLICAPFIYNAPFFTIFYAEMAGVWDILSSPSRYVCAFNGGLSIFGMLFSAAVFYLLAVFVFKYRRVERLKEPYCFPFVAPIVTAVLTLECYFFIVIAPWNEFGTSLKRVMAVFQAGKMLPGTEYAVVFFVSFFIFSALTSCSTRGAFKYLKLLPTLAVATYIFQTVWLGGWV